MKDHLSKIQHALESGAHIARCDVSSNVFDASLEESKATSVQRLALCYVREIESHIVNTTLAVRYGILNKM